MPTDVDVFFVVVRIEGRMNQNYRGYLWLKQNHIHAHALVGECGGKLLIRPLPVKRGGLLPGWGDRCLLRVACCRCLLFGSPLVAPLRGEALHILD